MWVAPHVTMCNILTIRTIPTVYSIYIIFVYFQYLLLIVLYVDLLFVLTIVYITSTCCCPACTTLILLSCLWAWRNAITRYCCTVENDNKSTWTWSWEIFLLISFWDLWPLQTLVSWKSWAHCWDLFWKETHLSIKRSLCCLGETVEIFQRSVIFLP